MKRSFVNKCLALLGYSAAATACGYGEVMYGPPMPDFKDSHFDGYNFEVSVTDQKGGYLNDIHISVINMKAEQPDTLARHQTDFFGKCRFNIPAETAADYEELKVVAEDLDGTQNGGDFRAAHTFVFPEADWAVKDSKLVIPVKFQLEKKEE